MPTVLILYRIDASKFKVLTSSTQEYVRKANKSKKKRVFRRMKVKLRAAVCWFSSCHQRSEGRSYCSSDLFWKYCQNSPFNSPQLFFSPDYWVKMVVLPQSIVSLGEAIHVPECFFEPWISSKFRVGEPCREAWISKKSSEIQVQLSFKFYTSKKQRK